MKIDIRQANENDKDGIWEVLSTAVEQGNFCIYSYDMSYDDIMNHWQQPNHDIFVATSDKDGIIGTFYLKPLEVGLSNHVVTGDFIVLGNDKSRGAMREMGNVAIREATNQGYSSFLIKAIQHNRRVLKVFSELGFHVTGTIPRAYRNKNGRFLAFVLLIRSL